MIAILQPDNTQIFFTASSSYSGTIDKHICRALLLQNNECNFDTFDNLIEVQQNIYFIKLNFVQWELSECTCYYWLKNFKCKHVISIAALKDLVSFESIAMNLPLEPKKRRGRRKMRKTALCRDEVEENIIEDTEFQLEEYGLQTIAPILSPKKKPAIRSAIVISKKANKVNNVPMKTRPGKRLRGDECFLSFIFIFYFYILSLYFICFAHFLIFYCDFIFL